jgi:hypothetical protein
MNYAMKYHFTILFLILVAGLMICAAPLSQCETLPAKSINNDYFCMHVHSHPGYEKAFSAVPFGMLLTWDSSIGWPQIEPEKNKWNWGLLDNYVRLARDKNIKMIMTLGMTPKWAAKNPDAPTPYGGNWSSSPPRDIADWENFIRKVAERNEQVYGGVIRYWEIWNEPDNVQKGYYFYTGTVEELIEMARVAREVLKKTNPDNMILSPGITQAGQGWLDRFLSGGGKNYIDVVGYHFYWVWYPPAFSDFEPAFGALKKVVERNGCSDKPLWVTETGFDVKAFKTQDKRNMALATLYIAPRYYGADAVCAYSWNGSAFTNLFNDEKQEPTETAAAYVELHKWLLGAAVTDVRSGKSNAKIIKLEKNGRAARIVWRYGAGKADFAIPESWGDNIFTLDGGKASVLANRKIAMGNSPVLICNNDYFE